MGDEKKITPLHNNLCHRNLDNVKNNGSYDISD